MECEFPKENATSEEISKLLQNSKNIAIVGISADETKDSYRVAEYLQSHGYKIFPVNPKYNELLGEKCHKSLSEIPEKIDIVDIFRKPEAVPSIVDEAIEIKTNCIWMQLGICNNKSAEKARQAGIKVVMNKCTKIEHAMMTTK